MFYNAFNRGRRDENLKLEDYHSKAIGEARLSLSAL